LFSLYYEQQQNGLPDDSNSVATDSLDLAFDDGILEDVKSDWKRIIADEADNATFMTFEERSGMYEDNDDNDNDGY